MWALSHTSLQLVSYQIVSPHRYSGKVESDPDVSSHNGYYTPNDADDLVANPLRHFVLLDVKVTLALQK